MSDMSGFGLPKSRPIAPKRRKPLTPYQSQRIRFGILAARDMLERGRLTWWQEDDLEGMELVGWRRGDAGTRASFDHTCERWRREHRP